MMGGVKAPLEYAGAYYHNTSRGNERKNIYRSNKDREQFLSYLKSAYLKYGAVILHKYSDKRLKEIGEYFSIGESAVSEASRQFSINLKKNKKLRGTVEVICKQLNY